MVRGDYGPVRLVSFPSPFLVTPDTLHLLFSIGKLSNIQDNAFIGATSEFSPPVSIGDRVSVGHGAVLKGCSIGSNTLIGMNAVISEGAEVGASSIIAAGSYVEENTVVPCNEVWAGSPAKKLRDLKPEEKDYLVNLPLKYREMSASHEEVMNILEQEALAEEINGDHLL